MTGPDGRDQNGACCLVKRRDGCQVREDEAVLDICV